MQSNTYSDLQFKISVMGSPPQSSLLRSLRSGIYERAKSNSAFSVCPMALMHPSPGLLVHHLGVGVAHSAPNRLLRVQVDCIMGDWVPLKLFEIRVDA